MKQASRLAEIEITGGSGFQHHLTDLCQKVRLGKIVKLTDLRTGRHRGWFTRERPEGCEPEQITVCRLQRSIYSVLDEVRGGAVFKVTETSSGRVFGYIYWSAPEWMAGLADMPLTYVYRSRSGREIKRRLYPLSVDAEPRRDRDAVLAGA